MRNNHYNKKNRRKYQLKAHFVLVTKYRKKLLLGEIGTFTKQCIYSIAAHNGWDIIAMETDEDHIHILLSYDTTDRVCDIVKKVKQITTYHLWGTHKRFLQTHYWKHHVFWSDGYFVCSIGDASSSTIEKYIAEQG